MAASLVLEKLFSYLISNKHSVLYDFLCPKFVQLFIKSRCDTAEFLSCMMYIVQESSLIYISDFLNETVTKCIKIIE
jgi:hypothetical protein